MSVYDTCNPDLSGSMSKEDELARLEALIAEETQKQKDLASEVGALYVRLHHDDYEPAFAEYMEGIKASEAAVKDVNAQMDAVKGIRRCACCGAEVDLSAAFCCSCGARIEKEQEPIPEGCTYCTNCGNLLRSGMRFCTQCGHPVDVVLEAPAEEPAAQPVPVEEAPAEPAPVVEPVETAAVVLAPASDEPVLTAEVAPEVQEAPMVEEVPMEEVAPMEEEEAPAPEAPAEQPAYVGVCPACGAPISQSMRFCIECGQPLDLPSAPAAPQEVELPKSTVSCPNCGAEMAAGLNFCTECGALLNGEKKKPHRKFF